MKNPFSLLRNLLSGKTSRPTPKPFAPRPAVPVAASTSWGPAEPAPEPEAAAPELTIELPFASVVYLLPDHLQARLQVTEFAEQTIGVPLQLVLPQLPYGDVRITFGQLRQAAPHWFTSEADEDETSVQLPFAELTNRCDPALMNYYNQLQAGSAPESAAAQPGQPEALDDSAPRSRPNLVAASRLGVDQTAPPPSVRLANPDHESPVAPVVDRSAASLSTGSAAPLLPPPVAPGLSESPAQPVSPSEVLLVALAPLAERWPEAVRDEIAQLNLLQAQVALPKELVSAGLKRGRVVFRWEALRSWLQPAVGPVSSPADESELELPLQVVAPLFLAREREFNKPRLKLQVDAEIPDVFGMARPAAAAPEPETKAGAPENALRLQTEPAPAMAQSAETNLTSTPEQLVSRAIQLKGVAGALVTLPDGLLVACRFPEQRNPENVAAFLPQIFARLGQYTEQLELGELATLEFLAGNAPWKVFRLKEVFFVVFGRGGEVLPSSELGLLAAELGKP